MDPVVEYCGALLRRQASDIHGQFPIRRRYVHFACMMASVFFHGEPIHGKTVKRRRLNKDLRVLEVVEQSWSDLLPALSYECIHIPYY